MNKKINLIFSIAGILTQIYFLINAFNIWFHNISINFASIVHSLFDILLVVVGIILTIISMIFHKENYKATNTLNYISIFSLVIGVILLVL